MKTATQVFDIEVRHGGDLNHSMPMKGVSDREIRLLRAIHGDDGVVNVKEAGEKMIDSQEELYELCGRYSKTMNPRGGRALVERVFGVELRGLDKWLADREELAEMERQERRQKAQDESAQFARAREAAEAQVRANIAARQAGMAPEQVAA